MAIDALEWVTIVSIGIVMFLWGPNKIPEIARSVSGARKKIQEASKDLRFLAEERGQESFLDMLASRAGRAMETSAEQAPPAADSHALDRRLLEDARRLGVVTVGKTKEEISREILERGRGQPEPAPGL